MTTKWSAAAKTVGSARSVNNLSRPIGNEKAPSGADTSPFRCCGEYLDLETGTYYLRARYYDPALGRFTQADTHWNTANMIYGDNPQTINQQQDALGLKTYTMVPQITAVMQSGNLYVYAVSNPVVYRDADGEIIISAIIAGAVVGGLISAGLNAQGQISNGASFDDINWASIGVSFIAGAASGAVAGSPVGSWGQVGLNAIISGAESLLQDKVCNRSINLEQAGIKAIIGAIVGLSGGAGAQAPKQIAYRKLVGGVEGFSTVSLTYAHPVAAKAAAKALALGLTKGFVVQIVVTDDVVKLILRR